VEINQEDSGMKKVFESFLLLGALLGSFGIALAADSIKFSWIANPPEDEATGYRLYMDCGSPECLLIEIPDPAATSWTMGVAPSGAHAFSLTAYRNEQDGSQTESGQSAYAIYQPKKKPIRTPGSILLEIIRK
jgi:hypothetical protein